MRTFVVTRGAKGIGLGPSAELAEADWRAVVDVDLTGSFLVSPDAGFATGRTLAVDGGWTWAS